MSILDNKLEVETIAARDNIVERRRFTLIHANRMISLTLRQKDNLDLWLIGNLYLNGGYYQIIDQYLLKVTNNNLMRSNTVIGNGEVFYLSPASFSFSINRVRFDHGHAVLSDR